MTLKIAIFHPEFDAHFKGIFPPVHHVSYGKSR